MPGLATAWLGVPFVLAGGGLALGLFARGEQSGRRAVAAIGLGALALLAVAVTDAVQAIDKLA